MSEQREHTALPWQSVGATRIWKTGKTGGAVAIIAEPECKNSGDFRELQRDSARWAEAMANADFIIRACNYYYETAAELTRLRAQNERLAGACEAIISGWGHQDGVSKAVELAREALAELQQPSPPATAASDGEPQ